MATIFALIAYALHIASPAENVQFTAMGVFLMAVFCFVAEWYYWFKERDGLSVSIINTLVMSGVGVLWFL